VTPEPDLTVHHAQLTGYHELGAVERIVPLAFVVIYLAALIRQATS
jgi:hypothetical protein